MHKIMVNNSLVIRVLIVLLCSLFMTACSYIPWFGDDEEVVVDLREPLELTEFVPGVRIQQNWQVSLGGDTEETRILLHPHVYSDKIAFTSTGGTVAVYDLASGRSVYSANAAKSVSAGVGGNQEYLIMGTIDGDVIAVNQSNGAQAWAVNIGSEVVSVASTSTDKAILRTNDNRIVALSLGTGEKLWTVKQTSPALTLRGAGVPLEKDGIIYAGMDNGKVIAVSAESGSVIWESRVSIPSGRSELDRIVDIDGQIAADSEFIYAASYHGRVVAISRINGRVRWARDIASISGVSVDDTLVFVTDRDDNVWALEKDTGISVWKQEDLLYRELSAPVNQADTILVGDAEGYLHALSKQDGSIVGRTNLGKKAIHTSSQSTSSAALAVDASGRLASYSVVAIN